MHILTRQQVAIKVIDKRKLTGELHRVRCEIEALKRLSHPNIYSLYHVIETDGAFYLVLEYVPGGELFDYILHNGNLEESHARILFRQLVSAICYSHSKGIAHRDLKPENILLKDDYSIRVIDFGLCAKNADSKYLNTFCGSLAYAAPEVLQNQEYSGPAADIWSMGVILYAMLMGCLPFDPSKPEKLTKLIVKGNYSVDETLSKSSQDLLARMLCVDPKSRIGMEELCKHPWVLEEGDSPIGFVSDPTRKNPQSLSTLNQEIVREIAMYTRIPQVEMTRMLKRRSYDYLTATYMIMERILDEEDILLVLQRPKGEGSGGGGGSRRTTNPVRQPSRSNPNVTSGTEEQTAKSTLHGTVASTPNTPAPPQHSSRQTHRKPRPTIFNPTNMPADAVSTPRRPVSTPDDSTSTAAPHQAILTEHTAANRDIQLMPPPAISKRSIGLQTPSRKEFPNPVITTLSPGRSIDSQLNQISKDLGLNDRENYSASRPPSEQILGRTITETEDDGGPGGKTMASSADDLLNSMCYDLDGTVEYSMSTTTNPQDHGNSFNLVGSGGGDISVCSSNATGSGTSVSHGSGSANLFRQFILSRKTTTTNSGGVALPAGSKLKKIRIGGSGGGILGSGNNNVMLAKPDLSAVEILEKISESLTKNSIRFTLKRHGFVCTFANDWGRALLEFSIEVVVVVGKTSISKRLHLQASKKLSSNTSTGSNPTPILDKPTSSSELQRGCSPSLEPNSQLGIKIKRLHGDAFTYASICRTVLDQAEVKAEVAPQVVAAKK
nr:maternal embryonic leucine zipper kinase [Hymenolepis microstoma]